MGYDFVISLPFLYNWTVGGEFSTITSIKSKLPLRMSIGFKKRKSEGLQVASYFSYDGNQFVDNTIWFEQKYGKIIKNFFLDYHYEISILSEVDRSRGLNFEHVLSLLLVIGLEKNIIGNTTLDYTLSEIKKDETIQLLIQKAQQLFSNFSNQTNLFPFVCCLVGNKNALVSLPRNDSSPFDNFYAVDELLDQQGMISNNVDQRVMFSGVPENTSYIDTSLIEVSSLANKRESLEKASPILSDKQSLSLSSKSIKSANDSMLQLFNTHALYAFLDLHNYFNIEEEVRQAIVTMGKPRLFLYTSKLLSRSFVSTINPLVTIAWGKSLGSTAIVPHNRLMIGGSYTAIVPRKSFRNQVEFAFSKNIEKYPNACIIYRPWKDGTETKGCVIEQDFNNGITPTSLQSKSIVIKEDGSKEFFYEGIDKKFDILVYLQSKKLSIAGNVLSSKDIRSQSVAVELLSHFFMSKSSSIKNKDLPVSSYAKNKNTMNSMIVGPLNKIIKNRLAIEKLLHCSGSLSNYKITKKQLDTISIGFVSEI